MLSKSYQLLLLSLIGWSLLLLGSLILGLSWSGYNLFAHTISVLASVVAPTRTAMNAIFVIDGILMIIFGYRFNQLLKLEEMEISTGHFISFAGVLLIALAFFPGGERMGVDVATQGLHNTIATFIVITFILAPFVFIWRMRNIQEWQPSLVVILVITGLKIFTYIASVIVVLVLPAYSGYAGLFQKTGLFFDATWIIFLSYQIVNLGLPNITN